MEWLKNVKLSSKSCFSPQELQTLSQDTISKFCSASVRALESSHYHMTCRMLVISYHIYYLRMPLMMLIYHVDCSMATVLGNGVLLREL